MGQNKARCTIQFVDAAGKPIKGLNYWLKDERDYQIAKGETNVTLPKNNHIDNQSFPVRFKQTENEDEEITVYRNADC